jgi:hypothetical protein
MGTFDSTRCGIFQGKLDFCNYNSESRNSSVFLNPPSSSPTDNTVSLLQNAV